MTKTILGAGALALALTGGAFAFGRDGGGHGGCGHDMLFGGRMLHALDPSADQRQKVDDIFTARRPKLQQLSATDKAASQAVADELFGTGDVTAKDLDAVFQRAATAHNDLMHERLAAALEVRNVLTADQLQKAAAIRAGMKQLHAQMHQLLGADGAD